MKDPTRKHSAAEIEKMNIEKKARKNREEAKSKPSPKIMFCE